jgi:hypothetical protein
MHQSADEDDAESEPSREHTAGGGAGTLVDVESRTRSQAALVRESLVRCPGGAGPGAQ